MKNLRNMLSMVMLASLIFWAGTAQAASIPGSAGQTTLQDGPNAEGVYFQVTVNYEAFDGLDATDPMGVTPGKMQFGYIIEYAAGNEYLSFFDLESVNGVPLIETAVSTNGTINGVTPGEGVPVAHGIMTMPSDNPAARFVYSMEGEAMFGGVGTRSPILAFTVSNEYGVGSILAQCTDTSLSDAGEVVGPKRECKGVIEGFAFCLNCGSNGQVAPMEGITVKVMSDGNEVASGVTGANGQYVIPGIKVGDYTVVAGGGSVFSPCSTNSAAVSVTCEAPAVANFCICPAACGQQITVKVVCDATGTAVAVPKAWVGIEGPKIHNRWARTKTDGTVSFKGDKVAAGHYKVRVKAPKGYELSGDSVKEFDLAGCEVKEVVFKACPIPPCTQNVCVKTVVAGDGNSVTALPGVKVEIRCTGPKTGVTGSDGQYCFSNIETGHHTVIVTAPEGYRLRDGDRNNKVQFVLARCEQKSVEFVLVAKIYTFCPKMPNYWKTHPNEWPVQEMWVGAGVLSKTQLMNILCDKLPNGVKAKCNDVSIDLAQYLIAANLSIAAGADPQDINPVIVASDQFLLYDYPAGSNPQGRGKEMARELKNKLYDYLKDTNYCEDWDN